MNINFQDIKPGECFFTKSGHRARFEKHITNWCSNGLGRFSLFNQDGDYLLSVTYMPDGKPKNALLMNSSYRLEDK